MFAWLLVVTLAVSAAVCFLINKAFERPIGKIMVRLVAEELASAWRRYVAFAIYVVGISGGVRIQSLDRYITPQDATKQIIELNTERWILEIYRTIIETMQGVAWMLLVFFVFALIAYVVLRGFEMKHGSGGATAS
jgi:hypothetical protein